VVAVCEDAARGQAVDRDSLLRSVEDLLELSSELRQEVAALAEQCRAPLPSFDSREAFCAMHQSLIARIESQSSAQRVAQQRLTALADLLEKLRARHRLPARESELDHLREDAIMELRKAAAGTEPVDLPEPAATAEEWKNSVMRKSGASLVKLLEELKTRLPRLALMIEETEPEWLAPKSHRGDHDEGADTREGTAELQNSPHGTSNEPEVLSKPSATVPASPGQPTDVPQAVGTTPLEATADTPHAPEPPATASEPKTATPAVGETAPEASNVPPILPEGAPQPIEAQATAGAGEGSPSKPPATGPAPGSEPKGPSDNQVNVPVLPPSHEDLPDLSTLTRLVWSLGRDGRWSLAYQIARAMHELEMLGGLPPPDLFRAIALGPWINGAHDEVEREAAESLRVVGDWTQTITDTRSLTQDETWHLLAASIRSALLAVSTTSASAILSSLPLAEWPELASL